MSTFAIETNEESKQQVVEISKNFSYDIFIREELKKQKVDELFEKVLKEKGGDDRIAWSALMGYANLLGDDEDKAKRLAADPKTIGTMVEFFYSACFRPELSWTFQSVLSPLSVLSINPNIRKILWDTKFNGHDLSILIPTALKQIKENNLIEEAGLLCGMTLQFCLDEEEPKYKQTFQNNEEFLKDLKELGNKVEEKEEWKLVKANVQFLIGALRTDEEKKRDFEKAKKEQMLDAYKNKIRIMISYNWQSQEKVKAMVGCLNEIEGVEVVWDLQFMSGNIYDKMASAVVTSDVIIIVLSSGYRQSANCKAEFCMAKDLKKRLILISVENDFKPTDFLFSGTAGMKINSLFDLNETKPVIQNVYNEFVAPIKETILNEKQKMDSSISLSTFDKKEKKTIFITYHASDEKLFQEVKGEVLKNKMDVVTNLNFKVKNEDHFFLTVMDFLEAVDVVIVLLNRSYCEMKEKRSEFLMCRQFNKKIIPIFTEKDFTGQGFDYIKLGISGSLFYSINDEKTKKQVMENVIKKELA